MDAIYLDNAATSFPKPAGVSDRMKYYLDCVGANVNRSVYTAAQEAGLVTLTLRQRLARLFDFPEPPTHVILTPGATAGLNMIISGLLRPGDHCIVSSMEHNAVMRPLLRLPGWRSAAFPVTPRALQIWTPAGAVPGEYETGHHGPRLQCLRRGTGRGGYRPHLRGKGCALCTGRRPDGGTPPCGFSGFRPQCHGGTGPQGAAGPRRRGRAAAAGRFRQKADAPDRRRHRQCLDSEYLPPYLPDRFESGTANLPGCYGWEAALRFIEETGVDVLRQHERALCARLLDGLADIPGVRLVGPRNMDRRVGVISVDFLRRDNAEMAYALEAQYGILTRCGLHCAPSAHKTLGTFPRALCGFRWAGPARKRTWTRHWRPYGPWHELNRAALPPGFGYRRRIRLPP